MAVSNVSCADVSDNQSVIMLIMQYFSVIFTEQMMQIIIGVLLVVAKAANQLTITC